MSEMAALKNYKDLIKKVDDKFQEIYGRHKDQFQCQKGCYSCCKKDLSVSGVEALQIKNYIAQNKEALSLDQGKEGFCDFLSEKGECLIYPVRPIICRSHGAPIAFKDSIDDLESKQHRDVCDLNFTDMDIQDLNPQDIMNIDTVNMLLAVINQHGGFLQERTPLTRVHFLDKLAETN